jgi:uncharacterized membrane protein (UPF0136 family)
MKLFGTSHIALHSFALLISLLLLCFIYEAGLRLFNLRVAVLATVLVAVQTVFLVQSSFVLPEILVALLVFASLYFYSTRHYLLTAIALTVLFYTKESGLVAGFVLGLAAAIQLFNKKDELKIRLFRLASVLVPCFLIACFFLIQHHLNNWYLYPEHTKLMTFEWYSFWYNFRINSLTSTILLDNRNYYFILLLLISVVAAIKNKSFKYLVLFPPAIITYYFADHLRATRALPGIPFFMLFIGSIAWMLFVLRKLKLFPTTARQSFIGLSFAFIFLYLCFSAANFFTPRYMLAAMVPVMFFAAVVFDSFISRTYSVFYPPVVLLILSIGYYSFYSNHEFGDCNPGAFDAMTVQQSIVDYMEKNNFYDKSIGTGAYLTNQHLTVAASGFLHTNKVFSNINWNISDTNDLAIFINIEPDGRLDYIKKQLSWHRVYRVDKGPVWAEIYSR